MELDDIAAIKLKAVTPPWQKTDESKWAGQFNKLTQKLNRGNLDILWNTEDSEDRLLEIKERRKLRIGVGGGGPDEDNSNLSPSFINSLLEQKYQERYTRMHANDPDTIKNADGEIVRPHVNLVGLVDPKIRLTRARPPLPDDAKAF